MIAFDDFLNNIEKYKLAYKAMGININYNKFFKLEDKRRHLQKLSEENRAKCNKLCGKIAELRNNNQNVSKLIEEITNLDKSVNYYNKRIDAIGKVINKKLNKLPNLPDELNTSNLQLETKNKESSINDLLEFSNNVSNLEKSNYSIKKYIRIQRGKIFEQSKEESITKCKNGLVILIKNENTNDIFNKIFDYFKENSLNIIKLSIFKIKKESASEYLIQLNSNTYLKLDFVREYYTRKYSIKYKNIREDATKFVNQINIYFK